EDEGERNDGADGGRWLTESIICTPRPTIATGCATSAQIFPAGPPLVRQQPEDAEAEARTGQRVDRDDVRAGVGAAREDVLVEHERRRPPAADPGLGEHVERAARVGPAVRGEGERVERR